MILLDDVQFVRRGWHNRDKIKTPKGASWLTVPVLKKGRYGQVIKDVKIDYTCDWRRKHLKTIERSYAKAPYFESCFEKVRSIYKKKHTFLIDLNLEIIGYICSEMDINVPYVFSSQYNIKEEKNQRLKILVKLHGGSVYLTGIGSRSYIKESVFLEENIELCWHEFTHPVYRQLHGEFIQGLSVLDYLMMGLHKNY